jgi:ribonuclease H-related protein
MKTYLYEKEVRAKASTFSESLESRGFVASVNIKEIRDYMIKISLSKNMQDIGKVKIYYKPSKKSYTLDLSELKETGFKDEIESLWHGRDVTATNPREQTAISSEYQAYVDGSFMNGKIGYGSVIVKNEETVHEIFGSLDDADALEQRQVPGEIEAVKKTIAWCKKNNIPAIEIYFDYMGLEKWATGQWKTNNTITRKYADYMKKTAIKVIWKKVKSHSGDKWNDHADILAKRALG